MVGTRFYLSHPELARARLERLELDLEWMNLPDSLRVHYYNYPDFGSALDLKATLALVERGLGFALGEVSLLTEQAVPASEVEGAPVVISSMVGVLSNVMDYVRLGDSPSSNDIRDADRYFRLELKNDFGHACYSELAASKARALAVELARNAEEITAEHYHVNAPYTPTLKQISVSYSTSIELVPGMPTDMGDQLLHVHPFGISAIDLAAPTLFPRYDSAGELYIGLRDLDPPCNLSLLLQLAEGTSDPELEPARVEWSCLDGDGWQPLELLFDSTRGLINSGIVELALPGVGASTRLPKDRYWLRLAISRSPTSVCNVVDIRTQAVTARFDDQRNAPDHYEQPLPAGSIARLQAPVARIAAVEQPFTGFGGKPAERPEHFYTRVSERLRHKQRALTLWDYERLVLQFSEIYKAKCLPAGVLGEPGCVDVIVIPDIRNRLPSDAFAPKAPANLLADIQTYLSERAPADARVRVRNARYVSVHVRLGVRFMPGQDESHATRRLNEDLNRFLSPWAYDEGADLMIGGKIFAISIIDFVDRRDYVDYVAEITLFRSEDGVHFQLVPSKDNGYHVAATRPDEVLVAAPEHHVDVISDLGYQHKLFTGIGHMRIEYDFIVA